jgi:hypothetical protein
MRSPKLFTLSALLLLTLLLNATAARADDTDGDEYDEHSRVARVSLMRGEVSLKRAGNTEWETCKLNLPLVEGDTLATGSDSRLEIQVDAYNFVRLGENAVLRLVTLRDEGIAFSLSEGTATLRLANFDKEREYFEIDAPHTTVAAERRGLYRIDVSSAGEVRVTVRDDGRARLYSESSGFVLRDKRTARLFYDGGEGDWEISSAPGFDAWDDWNDERERFLASRLKYEHREKYYDRDVWGAEELDAYGDWSYTSQYGWVWRPNITVVNNYYNWAPYRYGHWRWCWPYGWTWVADEDWGWAPYHYGRWVVYNNNWCWAPRGYGYDYHRAWWRPALVAFVYIPTTFGEHVAWYPLGHGQYDPRGRFWQHDPRRLSPLGARQVANLERANPLLLRAVSSVPVREFGVGAQRARPAAADVARRAVTGEPVRGRLPITPNYVGRASGQGTQDGAVTLRARPRVSEGGAGGQATAGTGDVLRIVRPVRDIPARTTGATTRTPGVALDGELRRTRVFNGREPRKADSSAGGVGNGGAAGGDAREGRDTGVVLRPMRPGRVAPPERDGSGESQPPERQRDASGGVMRRAPSPDAGGAPDRVRPAERERDREDTNNNGGGGWRTERPPRSAPRPSEDRPVEQPRVQGRPESDERVRPPEREERPAPAPRRVEPPQTREERPSPRPEPRYEPPPSRPAPAPQQREQPPPQQRQERPAPQPRNDAPRPQPTRPTRAKDAEINPDS